MLIVVFLVGCEAQFDQAEANIVTSETMISETPKPSLTPSPSPTPSLVPAPTAKATLIPVAPVELNTDEQALELINECLLSRTWYDEYSIFWSKDIWEANDAEELDIGEATKRLDFQAYSAIGYNNNFHENQEFARFITRGNAIMMIDADEDFSNIIVYDVDNDGIEELITSYVERRGYFAGMHLTAYKYGVPDGAGSQAFQLYKPYKNFILPGVYARYDRAEFRIAEDGQLHLYGVTKNETGEYVLGEDYGEIVIVDGKYLLPSTIEDYYLQDHSKEDFGGVLNYRDVPFYFAQ
jgi:hypothetical protein